MLEIFQGKNDIVLVRNIIIRGLSFVYLCSFVSLYSQIQGLWGDEGIYPVKNFIQKLNETYKNEISFLNFPTLLLFSDKINKILTIISPIFNHFSKEENSLHVICLLGILISLSIFINNRIFLNKFGFILLFLFYLTFYISGQIFVSNQWDLLLLEAGFIGIFLAPLKKSDLTEVSNSEETSYYLMRFLMFKYLFGTGVNKLFSNCEQWGSLNALNYLLQVTPFPHFISYYLYYSADFLKKTITAAIFVIEIHAPFFFFNCIFRRFRISAGIFTHFLQVFYILVGNYSFHYFLTIIVNLSVFDDQFIIAVVPHKLLKVFELDLGLLFEEKLVEKKKIIIEEKVENDKNKSNVVNDFNETTKEYKKINKNPYDIQDDDEKEEEEKDTCKREVKKNNNNPYDVMDDEEEIKVLPTMNEDEKYEVVSKTTNYPQEILTTLNFLCITLIWTFQFVFPFKDLVTGNFKINKKEFLSTVLNNSYMNYFMFIVFTFIVFKYIWNHLDEMNDEVTDIIDTNGSVLSSTINFFITFSFKIIFIVLTMLYIFGTVNSLYKGLNLKLSSHLFKGGLNLSNKYFQGIHIHNNYGLFKTKLPLDRQELEFKYTNDNNKWNPINFFFKPSLTNSNLRISMPLQSRLEWQISTSAYAKSVELNPFLVILLGKILERNIVILDLLGYHVPRKEFFNRYSISDKIFPKEQFNDNPIKIKIDLYKFTFSLPHEKSREIWTKSLLKEYFVAVEKAQLQKIFENYSLPRIDENRRIEFSPFQQLNILEYVIVIIIIYVAKNLFIN